MTNIWADTFSNIRELSLNEKKEKEEKNEKSSKRWWDDDGDGVGYEKGEVEGKFKKKVKKEEVEEVEEVEEGLKPLPKEKMSRQAGRAYDKEVRAAAAGDEKETNRQMQRRIAMQMPSSRRTALQNKNRNEEVEQIDEISTKLAGKVVNARIERTGAAADRENKARTPQNVRDTVAAADKEARARKLASGVRSRRASEANEERDLHSKSDKNDKLDIKKGINNKINTKPTVSEATYGGKKEEPKDDRLTVTNADKRGNTKAWQNYKAGHSSYKAAPHVKEEVKLWIEELVEEGYDIQQFSIEELIGIYESVELEEADTYGMPAKGDAERQKADPMTAAKAKAARAKVAKERADFQVAQQAQRMKVSTTESVIAFVEGRTPLFEGVFDPKKTKLKPASERTKNAMTDAQRKAAKKEAERTAEIHSKGETVLAGLRSSGKKGKVQTTPSPKAAAPEANRKVKGKQDKLAAAADKVLKGLKNK
jgi:hypothetical protein